MPDSTERNELDLPLGAGRPAGGGFAALAEDTRIVGYALAWLLEPLSVSQLARFLSDAGIRSGGGRVFTQVMLLTALNELVRAGLVAAMSRQRFEMRMQDAHLLVAEARQRTELWPAIRRLTTMSARDRGQPVAVYHRYWGGEGGMRRLISDLRSAYWNGQRDEFMMLFERVASVTDEDVFGFLLHPFDAGQILRLSPALVPELLSYCMDTALDGLHPAGEIGSLMERQARSAEAWRETGELALFRGDMDALGRVRKALDRSVAPLAPMVLSELRGAEAFLRGADGEAVAAFEEAMDHWRKATRRRSASLTGLSGMWFLMALLRRGRPADLSAAGELLKRGDKSPGERSRFLAPLWSILEVLTTGANPRMRDGLTQNVQDWLQSPSPGFANLMFFGLLRLIAPRSVDPDACRRALERLQHRAATNGMAWVAAEAAALRDAWPGGGARAGEAEIARLWKPFGPEPAPFLAGLAVPDEWERAILALEVLGEEHGRKGKGAAGKKKAASRKQLVWHLQLSSYGWALKPIERTVSGTGRVSKGRKVALKRLKERSGEMPHLTDQDRAVASRIARDQSWDWYGEYVLTDPKALLDLAGHPLVFSDAEARQALELVRASPRLVMAGTKDGGMRLTLEPKADYRKAEPKLVRESPARCLVLDIRASHARLFEILGEDGVDLPKDTRERVVAALGNLAGELAIESDDVSLGGAEIETMAADGVPVLRLSPQGEGLHARLMVRPVPGVELTYGPGEGKAVVFATRDGRQVRARRDLQAERASMEAVLQACPTLAEVRGSAGDQWSAALETPLECLELLVELHAVDPGTLVVEWPEGRPFRLHSVADASRFRLALGGGSEWLTASGKLDLDENLVLTMRQLLELSAVASDLPGFVRLEDGQFLALTGKFRRQLEDLRAFSQPGTGDQVRIHPLAALSLEDLAETPGVKLGAAWKRQMALLRDHPEDGAAMPPSTLQAELRPYQLEGYRWLRKLARWGMGACLADDMGLGKTVQVLAVLLERAADGPALVVAPTSVAGNWLEETLRFAPSLNPVVFGRAGADRASVLGSAGPFDLVIASYGLLQSEEEAMAEVPWQTVVLDEAQAIKNRATKRSQSAMKLQAGFRIVTTGTPVENRLAELHNLFQFINPGLLGSWERFRVRFADPIERDEDAGARDRLRRLIRPFILRRMKSAVLQDLPPRTEIALQVELEPEEAAFYEALRQKAVDDLAGSADDAGPGQSAIRILAELTRLRRACCHPKLIDPQTPLPGSKLRVFAETLQEILEGNHKVLVFSQFVDHLRLIRGHLESEGIGYQYLDGSVPEASRQKAVRDFQAGSGDVFLISLKAGGFGLNLTAADYVIHMDPWWNPAAEDQASDRAHRIGQTRPVTIYRLITSGTIEEKIVELHHRKRDLADSILEGTDSAGGLSAAQLLELLRA